MKLKTLHSHNPHCHWCGKPTLLIPREHHVRAHPDSATRDHVYSQWEERRYLPGGKVIVLACHECNGKRAVEQMRRARAMYGRDTLTPTQLLRKLGWGMSKLNPVVNDSTNIPVASWRY